MSGLINAESSKSNRSTFGVRITIVIAILTILSSLLVSVGGVKVLDINENLPDLIEKHPEKNWLIKFYAPWCHHCQQLEPTYNNVAERIYHQHETLIVGRVDCTRASRVCEQFSVNSYPSIKFINKNSNVDYRGDRSEGSILEFADRLQGPTVNIVHDCKDLLEATNKHGLIIVSTITNSSNQVKTEFESLAHTYKSTHSFYQYSSDCKNLFRGEGLYLLKRHLNKSIKFELPLSHQETTNDDTPTNNVTNLKSAIINWLNEESFPIYGLISFGNIERALATGKLLVISILDEYKPARRFTSTSREFSRRFGLLAREYAYSDDEVLFGWSSDVDLIGYITISSVSSLPNVILLKSDFRYYLMLSNASDVSESKPNDGNDKIDSELLEKLSDDHIRSVIYKAKAGELVFNGGNSYLYTLMRYIMSNINKFLSMYRANPLLVSVIFGFPSLIIIFVIYTTCFYEGRDMDEEDEGYSDDEVVEDDENQRLFDNGHLKQD
jgi:thioredoxin domain-containing protein 10